MGKNGITHLTLFLSKKTTTNHCGRGGMVDALSWKGSGLVP